jgi:hypothetical protein
MNPYVGYENIVPLLAPVDESSSDTKTAYLDLKGVNRAAILLIFGNIHSGTAADTETITVEAASDPAAAEAAITFKYRKSGAVGDNTWGAISAATTAGFTVAITDDNKCFWLEIDVDALAANEYRYVRASICPTTASQMANCVVGALGVIEPRYKMTTFASATASASA